jgi:hypothetical protein
MYFRIYDCNLNTIALRPVVGFRWFLPDVWKIDFGIWGANTPNLYSRPGRKQRGYGFAYTFL